MSVWTKLDPKGNLYPQILWQGTSPYNPDIKVVRYRGIIRLISGGFTQSKKLVHLTKQEGYWQAQVDANDLTGFKKPRVLILGLGGGTMVELFRQKYPDILIDGVEIDKMMVDLGKKYLGLTDKNLNIFIADAADFVKKTSHKYDLICVDVFLNDQIPGRCDAEEFYEVVGKLLKRDGKVVVNRIFEKKGHWGAINPRLEAFRQMLARVLTGVSFKEIPSSYNFKNYIFTGGRK